MKKLFSIPVMFAICVALMTTSCKKDKAAAATGSGDLGTGKSSISFDNSGSFAGGTSFSLSNSITNSALSTASGSIRNISLSASEITGMNSRTVTITVLVPAAASTSAGNLVGDFASSGADIFPALTLSSTTGSTPGMAYVSDAGTITITKLTATEIEGTFTAVVKNDGETETLNISNGKFAGKF